ncbi:MAG: UDP-N-acetylmuramoyl-tripeptide--D-alanyl-D-alanine ligase [Gaiellales bacterium]
MIPLTAHEVATACDVATDVEATVTGLAVDSRQVQPGDLFAALPGERTDGVRFVAGALAAGAALALVPTGAEAPDGPLVAVPDPLDGLGRVAAEVRRRSQAAVVAITGSTGKTSTKDILAALLVPRLQTVASYANFNTEIGVPLTLGRIEPSTQAVVCELGMRGPGQVAYLAGMCRPDVAVITGIGPVHLEMMGTIEAVAAAKAELLRDLGPSATAVVPHAEPLLEPHLAVCRARILTFGEQAGADVQLTRFRDGQAEFAVCGRMITMDVSFPQRHNALNLAAALAACRGMGMDVEELTSHGLQVVFSRWRGEQLELAGGGILIADCYNANPTSMAAALRHLATAGGSRRPVAILGDMAELGEAARSYHLDVGAQARDLGIEVIAVGPLARDYGGRWYADRDALVGDLDELLHPGDAVLVKGSRSMGLEAVVEALVP